MINVDFANYFRSRIWFGWWYRGYVDDDDGIYTLLRLNWCRDPNSDYHRGIYMMSDGRNGKELHYWDWLTKHE